MPRWVCVVAALATASAHVIYHKYYSGDAAAAHRSSVGAEQLSPTRAHGGRERTSSVVDADSVGDAVHAAAALTACLPRVLDGRALAVRNNPNDNLLFGAPNNA